MALADADVVGGDLNQLIVIDEFHGLLQTHFDGRRQNQVFIGAGRTNVGQLLAFNRIHRQVVIAVVNTDHHAFVDFRTVTQEQTPPLLYVEQAVGGG